MDIEQRTVGNVVVLSIRGDLTMDGAWETPLSGIVRRALEVGHDRFVVDLARVRYADSIGLGELAQALAVAQMRGGAMKLLNVTRRVADLLMVTNLLMVFECFDCESEACASFDRLAMAHRSSA
jgi:anti-sigma B factor antagonist